MSSIKYYQILSKFESIYLKSNIQPISVGDVIKLGIKIEEGEKTRIQNYSGVVISKKNKGLNKTITVRRVNARYWD